MAQDDIAIRVKGPSAPAHGGTLAVLARTCPDAPRPWIDLSTGINPYPWPYPAAPPAIPPEALTRLPEPDAIAALEHLAARRYGVPEGRDVAAAPGTQILISVLPRLRPARHVAVVGPTYSEHAIAWRDGGATVDIVPDLPARTGADTLVVVNPNNPDGRRFAPTDLHAAAARCRHRGGLLVVDEAFADLAAPPLSCIPDLPDDGLVVLRSFGKSYGYAGIRLGFAVAGPGLAASIRSALGPWAISGPALNIGLGALEDSGWPDAIADRLDRDTRRLDAAIGTAGLRLVGGTRLFRLAEGKDAPSVSDRLARAGIAVRRFDDRPDRLRFGLPGNEPAWRRLEAALRG